MLTSRRTAEGVEGVVAASAMATPDRNDAELATEDSVAAPESEPEPEPGEPDTAPEPERELDAADSSEAQDAAASLVPPALQQRAGHCRLAPLEHSVAWVFNHTLAHVMLFCCFLSCIF